MLAKDFFRLCLEQNDLGHLSSDGFPTKFLPQRFVLCGYKGEVIKKHKHVFCVLRMNEPLVAYLEPLKLRIETLWESREFFRVEDAEWLRCPPVSYTKIALYA